LKSGAIRFAVDSISQLVVLFRIGSKILLTAIDFPEDWGGEKERNEE
jgi:hypothetical protein